MKKIKGCPFRDLKARIAQALPFGTLSALLIFSSDLFVHPPKTISLHFFFLFVWITVNMSLSLHGYTCESVDHHGDIFIKVKPLMAVGDCMFLSTF